MNDNILKLKVDNKDKNLEKPQSEKRGKVRKRMKTCLLKSGFLELFYLVRKNSRF